MDMAKKLLVSIKNCVILPDKCSLQGPFNMALLPMDTLINKEYFGIKDALENVSVKDVVHVQGVLLSRYLQTSKFQQNAPQNGFGYGVPEVCITWSDHFSLGGKNIILQLQDLIDNETVNVYIITWTTKQYPLGLLPGSTICIKFIEKRCSSRNNQFFQSTCLTSIKVLEYPAECIQRVPDVTGAIRRSYLRNEHRERLLKSPFWAILSVSNISSLDLTPTCSWCGSQVTYRQFDCMGCAHFVKKPTIQAKANFSVEDGSGHAYLRVKNDHVRIFLDLSEEEWKNLEDLAMEKQISYFREGPASLQKARVGTCTLDEDQLAFKFFCENVAITKLWQVVCNKFFNQGDEKYLKLFCIDVKEVDFELAESLVD